MDAPVDASARAATPAAPVPTHADLTSMREARDLVARAQVAQRQLAELSQAQIDAAAAAATAALAGVTGKEPEKFVDK